MGRKQLPLAGNTELERFALRLREARADAGLTVRKLAARTGYSVGTIAKAESGRQLPSWPVAEAFAQACGIEPARLRRAWYLLTDDDGTASRDGSGREEVVPDGTEGTAPGGGTRSGEGPAARGEVGGDGGVRSGDDPSGSGDTAPDGAVPPNGDSAEYQEVAEHDGMRPVRVGDHRPWRWLVTGCALTAIVALATALLIVRRDSPPATAAAPSATSVIPRPAGDPQPVADHSDPYRADCVKDATTVDAVRAAFPDLRGAGSVELRVSPSCHVAWSRFLPYAALDYMEDVVVTVVVERPSTGTAVPFRVDAPHGEVWSDILLTGPGCVVAKVEVTAKDRTTGTVATRCLSAP